MAFKLNNGPPLYDPIKAQVAILQCDEEPGKKAMGLELALAASYKGESKLNSSLVPENLKEATMITPKEWLRFRIDGLDYNRLNRITKYQTYFLATEKNSISALDYVVFSAFTILCDEYMTAYAETKSLSKMLKTPPGKITLSMAVLVSLGWLERTHSGYSINVPVHVTYEPTGWIQAEDV